MTDTPKDIKAAGGETQSATPAGQGKPALAWISLTLALVAWAALLWLNGYIALFVAIVSAVVGFFAIPRRSAGAKRLAITAIIASTVLIVVVAAYLVVIKIGLA